MGSGPGGALRLPVPRRDRAGNQDKRDGRDTPAAHWLTETLMSIDYEPVAVWGVGGCRGGLASSGGGG